MILRHGVFQGSRSSTMASRPWPRFRGTRPRDHRARRRSRPPAVRVPPAMPAMSRARPADGDLRPRLPRGDRVALSPRVPGVRRTVARTVGVVVRCSEIVRLSAMVLALSALLLRLVLVSLAALPSACVTPASARRLPKPAQQEAQVANPENGVGQALGSE